jgi:hypothetical protein
MKIVLALQYWDGDKDMAMRNARRIADNEPKFRDDVEMCFVHRFDSSPDAATIDYVSKKMEVSVYKGQRRGVGWPGGCNDLWCDLMQEAVRRSRTANWRDAKAIFTFEADCIPIAKNWIDEFHREWDAASAEGKLVAGAWCDSCTPLGHVNGNAMFHLQIALKLGLVGCAADMGWDVAFAMAMSPHWKKSGLIKNLYRAKNVSDVDIRAEWVPGVTPVMVHGVKDLSVEAYADRVLRTSGS